MTDLLYLPDSDDVTSFSATVTEATDDYVVLDGTYFYPEGGGQPPDHGKPDPGTTVEAEIDAQRRERLTRMHTAQHVVSRVVLDEYGAGTAGNQVGVERSRIDFEPADFDGADLERIERLSNEAIERDHDVVKENRPRERVEREVDEGRALLELIPDSVDPLRVVEIDGFDLCPCGGTHVGSLGEVGRVEIVDRSSKGEDTERIEFELRSG
ncbi:alanyl-tRNA editing protein [Halobacteriales archaeon QH_10_70_21]|nr:MAG: alanyl-tRNA editing protein [Halobacteriales archaeon QH_10_70_21]